MTTTEEAVIIAKVRKRAPAKKAAKKRVPTKKVVAAVKANANVTPKKRGGKGQQWGNNSPTGPRMIAAQRKANEAVELRAAGLTFGQIATQLGYPSEGNAWRAVMKVLKNSAPESTDQVRQMEVRRLDAMFRPLYVQALRGDRLAVDRCLKIMERRAGLLGLDAPIRIQQMVITEDQIREGIARLRQEVEVLEARSWSEDEEVPEWDDDDDDGEAGVPAVVG